MAMYFDFETTVPTDNCFNPEKKNVCYVLWEPVGLLLKYIHTINLSVSKKSLF